MHRTMNIKISHKVLLTRDKHISLDRFMYGSVTAVVCYVNEVVVVILVVAKMKQKNLGGNWEIYVVLLYHVYIHLTATVCSPLFH
jgi:hypothetical protein